MAVTLETPLGRVLGPKTAKGMAEQLNLHTVRRPAAPLPAPLRPARRDGPPGRPAGRRPGHHPRPGHEREQPPHAPAARHHHRGHRRRRRRLDEARLLQLPARRTEARRAWACSPARSASTRASCSSPTPTCTCSSGDDDERRRLGPRARAHLPGRARTSRAGSSRSRCKLLLGAGRRLRRARRGPAARGDPRRGTGCSSLAAALLDIHRPTTAEDVERARHRLKWDEALDPPADARRPAPRRRARTRHRPARAGPAACSTPSTPRCRSQLTEGQREVGEELAADLDRDQPMHRLLQGEVGSGKTVVALRAMAQVVDAGGQAALLAPTEVLAAQHARGIRAAARARSAAPASSTATRPAPGSPCSPAR